MKCMVDGCDKLATKGIEYSMLVDMMELVDMMDYGCKLKGMKRFLWFWFKTPMFFWSAGYKVAMNSVNSKIRIASDKDKILKIEL